jgi:hypothetical protein
VISGFATINDNRVEGISGPFSTIGKENSGDDPLVRSADSSNGEQLDFLGRFTPTEPKALPVEERVEFGRIEFGRIGPPTSARRQFPPVA